MNKCSLSQKYKVYLTLINIIKRLKKIKKHMSLSKGAVYCI